MVDAFQDLCKGSTSAPYGIYEGSMEVSYGIYEGTAKGRVCTALGCGLGRMGNSSLEWS